MTKSRLDLCRSFGAFEVHKLLQARRSTSTDSTNVKREAWKRLLSRPEPGDLYSFFYGDIPNMFVTSQAHLVHPPNLKPIVLARLNLRACANGDRIHVLQTAWSTPASCRVDYQSRLSYEKAQSIPGILLPQQSCQCVR